MPQLSEEEKVDYLQRLSLEEPGLSLKLNQRLSELADRSKHDSHDVEGVRTISDLQDAADTEKEKQKAREEESKKKKREAYLMTLSKDTEKLWQEVYEMIQTMLPKKYDQAVSTLLDLHDLAVLQGDVETFQKWLQELVDDYASRRGLLRRLRSHGLLD